MTALPDTAPPRARGYRIPVLGWIAHDVVVKGGDNIWYFLVMALGLVAIAVMAWGLPALVMVALSMVPVVFAVLLLITLGR
ncbi:MAG: hypothetical protein K2X91_15075 [Thermoleophilia bacterium]|nr:hypothetical protein [Thermoleophilia bacterium]